MTPINISYYKNAKDNKGGIISVNDAIKRIKNDALLVEATQHYRSLPAGKEKDEKKKTLFPAVTWSGLFSKRKAEAIQQHSGLICIDIDKLETEQLNGFKKLLTNDKHVYLMFISPSGKGLKILFKIQADSNTHLQYFNYISFYLQKEYGLQVDPSGKDVSRLCFLCYDAQPYFNVDAELISIPADFEVKPAPQQPKPLTKKQETQLTNASETPNDVFEFTQSLRDYVEGDPANPRSGRNNFVFLYANNCNRKGIDYNDCLHFALQAFSDLTESEVTTSIKSAYKNTNQHATFKRKTTTGRTKNGNETAGKNAVQNNAGNNKNSHQAQTTPGSQSQNGNTGSTNNGTDRSNEDASGNVHTGNSQQHDEKVTTEQELFWHVSINENTGKETISINYTRFYDFLETLGVYNLKLNGENVELIHLKNNIVTPVIINNTRNDVKVLLNRWCKQYSLFKVLEMLHRGQDKYFARKQFINLPYKEVNFLRDTKEVSYFYHKNCVVEVSAQGIHTRPYEAGEKAIWNSQRNAKDFTLTDITFEGETEKGLIDYSSIDCEFAQYMLLACSNPETTETAAIQKQRFMSHMTAFGYMIDGYKPSNCKAIVAVDHKKAEDKTEQNGGTGKGLFAKALSYVKQTFVVDGERFDPKDNSVFESVTMDTKIIAVVDCNPRFNFRYFFNSINGDFTFRKMYIGPVTIPFKDSLNFTLIQTLVSRAKAAALDAGSTLLNLMITLMMNVHQ